MGMESVKLSKPWLDHEAKETVQVDPERAAWLRDNGYVEPEPSHLSGIDALLSGKPFPPGGIELPVGEPVSVMVDLGAENRRGRLRPPAPAPSSPSPFPGVEIVPPPSEEP